MMNVLGRCVIAHQRFARLRCVLGGNGIERLAELHCFIFGENLRGEKSGRVRLAGGDLLVEKPPIEADGTLPGFELAVQRLAKTARPHLPGLLFVGHCFKRTSRYSLPYAFSGPLLSLGISHRSEEHTSE